MPVTLTSSDAETFVVDREVVKHAGTIENLITSMGLDDADTEAAPMAIPLPNVKGRALKPIIDWLTQHKDDPVAVVEEGEVEKRTDNIPKWDRDFLGPLDMSDVLEILMAANYLDIKVLIEICCKFVAGEIKDKTPDQIRKRFDMVNDFTPEEDEQIQKENAWFEQ